MNEELISKLRTATVADTAESLYQLMTDAADEIERLRKDEIMGIIAEQAYEIHRLKTIIKTYWDEERAYNDYLVDETIDSYTIPHSWKAAYRALEQEAMAIEEEEYDNQ